MKLISPFTLPPSLMGSTMTKSPNKEKVKKLWKTFSKQNWLEKTIKNKPRLIQRFLRNFVGMLSRNCSPLSVAASWRLLPLLPTTCDILNYTFKLLNPSQLPKFSFLTVLYPHNLLVFGWCDILPQSFIHYVLAFGCLWHGGCKYLKFVSP